LGYVTLITLFLFFYVTDTYYSCVYVHAQIIFGLLYCVLFAWLVVIKKKITLLMLLVVATCIYSINKAVVHVLSGLYLSSLYCEWSMHSL
jgi:hypothetical protein